MKAEHMENHTLATPLSPVEDTPVGSFRRVLSNAF